MSGMEVALLSALTTGSVVGTSTAAGAAAASIGATAAAVMPTALKVGGTLLSLGGAVGQHRAATQQAASQEAAARVNQRQLEYQAGQETAASQREANAKRRQADIMMSRAMAVGAASGAGTSGIEGLLSGIAGEGETQAQFATYEGAERAKGAQYRGQVGVSEAKQSAKATRSAARSNLLSSAASTLYGRFA